MTFLSVIVPLKNEEKSLTILHKELTDTLNQLNKPYEVIFVDDGSTDNSYEILLSLQKKDRNVRLIRQRANFGKSEALSRGFAQAQGELLVMIDADLQDDPREIPKLIQKIDDGYDIVSGWRKNRLDTLVKRISSLLFNKVASIISGLKLHDFNCGLKVLRKEVADELYLHGELHRFIPILAFKRKFKVAEAIVNHRPRKFGESKYGKLGISRGWKGMIDLFTAIFLTDYSTKPAHFFGKIGLIFFLIGFLMDAYVTYIKISTGTTEKKIPLLLAGILFILVGIQLLSTGLIAEMIANYFSRKSYSKKD